MNDPTAFHPAGGVRPMDSQTPGHAESGASAVPVSPEATRLTVPLTTQKVAIGHGDEQRDSAVMKSHMQFGSPVSQNGRSHEFCEIAPS